MTELLSILKPDFILQNALWASVVVGVFCPLIGVYFYLRRMVLLGVALPQVSSAGVSFVFFLQGFGAAAVEHAHEPGHHDAALALAGSLAFTIAAIFLLGLLDRRGDGANESRLGAVFALAFAASILFVNANPTGEIELMGMLRGEIVAVTSEDLRLLLGGFALLAALLLALNKHFLFVSFDRESARVMGKNIVLWDVLLYLLIGIAISLGVIVVGPMLTFAFLVVPPLAARRFASRMWHFFVLSSFMGAVSGLLGFYISYRNDWPLGPTGILISGLTLIISYLVKKSISLMPGNK